MLYMDQTHKIIKKKMMKLNENFKEIIGKLVESELSINKGDKLL